MKIAVIDHISNLGGGSRVVRSLLAGMRQARPELEITFFGNPHGILRENLREVTADHGISLEELDSMKFCGRDLFKLRGSRHVVSFVQRKWNWLLNPLPFTISGQLHKELQKKVRGYDIAFFTWPFHLKCPDLDCPMVGIFHDLNFRYSFGGNAPIAWVQRHLVEETPLLLDRMTPVVSTEYMKTEVEKFYPQLKKTVRVVPIAPMSTLSQVDESSIEQVRRKFKLPKRYLLVPTHVIAHKNNGQLMGALNILAKKGYDIPLVFVGSGTDALQGKACNEGVELSTTPHNIFGLGYVSNQEIDALIQGATMVVNASLYEGGNGPGFDAWSRGIPVAMSNIPPFLEHLAYHRVKAAVFDPRNVYDIVEKIAFLLDNPLIAQENARDSQIAIRQFTWEESARKYLEIFDEICSKGSASPLF